MRIKESIVRNVVTLVDGLEQDAGQLATMDFIEKSSGVSQNDTGMAVVMAVSREWLTPKRSADNQQKFYVVSEAGKRVLNGW